MAEPRSPRRQRHGAGPLRHRPGAAGALWRWLKRTFAAANLKTSYRINRRACFRTLTDRNLGHSTGEK